MRRFIPYAFLSSLAVLVVIGARPVDSAAATVRDPIAQAQPIASRGELDADERATVQLFKRSSPSVVHIRTTALVRNFFAGSVTEQLAQEGSGFVWDAEGYLVTNFHVIRGAKRLLVYLEGRVDPLEAQVVGTDPSVDLAVLKIDPAGAALPVLPVGTSVDLQVGQKVFAIGNPFGYDQTLTTGIISALEREITSVIGNPIRGVIQTDAAINPGNSGGPLLDSSGRLIGINTMIASPSGASAGIGFAVPVDTVNRVVPEIIRTGSGPAVSLGMSAASDRWTRSRGLRGVVVAEVKPNGAAARAGLRPAQVHEDGRVELGDVITAVNGKSVNSQNELELQLLGRAAGETLKLTVMRDGETREVEVVLDAAP
ncbi:MAG: trypsin-like peptidase domain-containing protein [Planctomycetota bacterium]|nr:trypsin-like peptidase domain-containing protein [Planctomycetota bacterium]